MAYRAEIEIGVKGQQRIQRLSSEINKSAKAVDSLADSLGSRGVVSQSLNNFDKLLNRTKRTLDSVIAGTDAEKKAVKEYVTVLGQANSFQERQNRLIAEEIRQRNGATAALKRYNAAAVPGRQPGGSMAGRYLRPGQARGTTQFGGPIGPGPASATALSSRLPASSRFFGGTQFSGPIGPGPASSIFGGQSSAVEGRIKRILAIKKDELQLERALIGLQQKSKGLDAESIKENNRLLNLKADEVARNKEIIRQERVKQSILRKRQRLEAAGRTPGGGRRGKRGGQRFTDIATGAGFPLLFGGGPLQALAGGLGGAAGGLGGAIAASAIVSQVEAFATAAAQAGQALNSTGGALDFMREKSLFSTAQVEENAAVLEEQGRVQELAALLTQELTDKIGNEGVRSLQELGKTTDETTRLWSELTTQLFALISGPLNGFLKIVNQVLGAVTGAGSREAFFGDLGSQEQAARARFKELTGESLGTGRSGTKARAEAEAAGRVFLSQEDALKQIRKEFTAVNPVSIPVTAADQRRFTGGGTAGDKAAREEARIQKRLAALKVERQKILEISGFKDKIAAAEAAQDAQLVIRLQGEQRVAQIEAKRLADLTKVKDQRVIDAINITAATEKLAAHRETERQITEEQRKRQELFETTIEGLEHQLEMTEATSQAERDRLRIARELKKLDDKGFSDAQLGQAKTVMEQLAVAQQPLNAFIRKTTEDLNNLQQVAVDVSQGIGNAIGSSLVNGLQSLVTGAASIKEVFANMLKSVADVLANTAAKMIAQYIAIGIARAFAGLAGGGGETTPPTTLPGSASQSGLGLNINGVDQGISPFGPGSVAVASGGYVSGPTRALVGEGGEPEYVIPESKMRESMARYSRGARGGSVIPEAGGSGTSGEGGGEAVAAPIDVRYTVERINSVDYVTADQFQAGMRRAADEGAKQGEQKTLKRLQMSGGTRKRLGM